MIVALTITIIGLSLVALSKIGLKVTDAIERRSQRDL